MTDPGSDDSLEQQLLEALRSAGVREAERIAEARARLTQLNDDVVELNRYLQSRLTNLERQVRAEWAKLVAAGLVGDSPVTEEWFARAELALARCGEEIFKELANWGHGRRQEVLAAAAKLAREDRLLHEFGLPDEPADQADPPPEQHDAPPPSDSGDSDGGVSDGGGSSTSN